MRLTELAAEIGITPAEAWLILANHDAFGWDVSGQMYNLYGMKIPPEFVEKAREILLGASADNVKQFIAEKHGVEENGEENLDDLQFYDETDDEEPT